MTKNGHFQVPNWPLAQWIYARAAIKIGVIVLLAFAAIPALAAVRLTQSGVVTRVYRRYVSTGKHNLIGTIR